MESNKSDAKNFTGALSVINDDMIKLNDMIVMLQGAVRYPGAPKLHSDAQELLDEIAERSLALKARLLGLPER